MTYNVLSGTLSRYTATAALPCECQRRFVAAVLQTSSHQQNLGNIECVMCKASKRLSSKTN